MSGAEDPPNVLLVILDSVRAANTSLHGHEHRTTPFLEELAEEATHYTQARSPSTWSLPSHASMFTGYHVIEHGLNGADRRLEAGHTIFEWLGTEHGYTTGVFSENNWITDMDVGLKSAFDTVEGARNVLFPDALDPTNFVVAEGQGQYLRFLRYSLEQEHPLKSIANGVYTKVAWDYPGFLPDRFTSSTHGGVYRELLLDWIAEREGPWAACLNLMDAHLPYLPDADHDQWGGGHLRTLQDEMADQVWEFNGDQRPWWQRRALEGLYDGTVHQMDAELEKLVASLRARGAFENTLLIVTSDHGEGFGELSRIRGDRDAPRPNARVAGHGAGIHEVLTHVPLLVNRPGQTASERVDEVVSLTSIPAAIRSVVSGESSGEPMRTGIPVLTSSHGLEEPMEEWALRYTDDLYRFNGEARAAYEGFGHDVTKYVAWRDKRATVRTPEAKCGFLTAGDDAGIVEKQFRGLNDRGVSHASSADIDPATQQRLRDLGYR